VIDFCQRIFAAGGAVLCGPGGGRFVYELRAHFDLFCKLTPLQPLAVLQDSGPLRPQRVADVDIIAVRENTGGLYFGEWGHTPHNDPDAVSAFHTTAYQVREVDRILAVAHRLACRRRGRLCVVYKPSGLPAISQLWAERTAAVNHDPALTIELLEVDNAAYQLIADAQRFDVIVAPNLFGDVLADCGALLLGSRGMSFSGNFSAAGAAVYQTGHGAAYDLAGRGSANPLGQIQALAMMLRESYAWPAGADLIEAAIGKTLAAGWRTADIAAPGMQVIGTQPLTARICTTIAELASGSDG
jgi:3-isopropylmalate dehydrogenase